MCIFSYRVFSSEKLHNKAYITMVDRYLNNMSSNTRTVAMLPPIIYVFIIFICHIEHLEDHTEPFTILSNS